MVKHFADKITKLVTENTELKKKLKEKETQSNSWKCKCWRKCQALNRFKKYTNKQRIVELKVDVKHQRFRQKMIEKMILHCETIGLSVGQSWREFIEKQVDILLNKDKEFKKKLVNKTFKDVIEQVNKNGRYVHVYFSICLLSQFTQKTESFSIIC